MIKEILRKRQEEEERILREQKEEEERLIAQQKAKEEEVSALMTSRDGIFCTIKVHREESKKYIVNTSFIL